MGKSFMKNFSTIQICNKKYPDVGIFCYNKVMDFKDLRHKTWIEWVKVIVAVDIAFVGFGLIIDQDIHLLSHIFGFLTRIPFGIMYIFIAILILKRVFPKALHVDPKDDIDMDHLDADIAKGVAGSQHRFKKIINTIQKSIDRLIDWVDHIFDTIAHFFEKRHHEVKKELKDLADTTKK